MPGRLFTVPQAEALIPALEGIFGRLLQLHGQIRAVQQELADRDAPATADLLDELPDDGPDEVRRLRGRFRALYEAISDEVHAVEALGAEVKDLEAGLVDFHTLRGGKDEVLLCWRYGEKRIAHWHRLRGGFSGRRPIEGESFVGSETELRESR